METLNIIRLEEFGTKVTEFIFPESSVFNDYAYYNVATDIYSSKKYYDGYFIPRTTWK